MTKNTTPTGIMFHCHCGTAVIGGPSDILMSEISYDIAESTLHHEVFIENAPYDPAGYIVNKDCLSCGLTFLTMIIIGDDQTVMYRCTCGYTITHAAYMLALGTAG